MVIIYESQSQGCVCCKTDNTCRYFVTRSFNICRLLIILFVLLNEIRDFREDASCPKNRVMKNTQGTPNFMSTCSSSILCSFFSMLLPTSIFLSVIPAHLEGRNFPIRNRSNDQNRIAGIWHIPCYCRTNAPCTIHFTLRA
jgi:hypothetical protein